MKQLIGILNCAIITSEGDFSYKKTTLEEVKSLLENAYISAVGHQGTAQLLSTLIGKSIPSNRIQFKQEEGQTCIVFSLKKRIEEGRILSIEEIEEVGYDFFLLKKEA